MLKIMDWANVVAVPKDQNYTTPSNGYCLCSSDSNNGIRIGGVGIRMNAGTVVSVKQGIILRTSSQNAFHFIPQVS